MIPAARVQTAIEILERTLAGTPVEKVLTSWARRARYAGSSDRAAVRDLVFQALRCRESYAEMGGGLTGRGLMIGHTLDEGQDISKVFSGARHGPSKLTDAEKEYVHKPKDILARDMPDWLWAGFVESLGQEGALKAVAQLRCRAPVAVRVNLRKANPAAMVSVLSDDGIEAVPVTGIPGALHIKTGARRLSQTDAFRNGEIELQDAHSQAAVEEIPVMEGARVLDYCAGGGGKTLALASRITGQFFAYDADPARMADLPERAARAGVTVERVSKQMLLNKAPYDLIICDVPCSGSGTWRRSPQTKWALTPENLESLLQSQQSILAETAKLMRPGGILAYATCSVLESENGMQIDLFLRNNSALEEVSRHVWPICDRGDGFFLSVLSSR